MVTRNCIYCKKPPIIIPNNYETIIPKFALVCEKCGLSSRFYYMIEKSIKEWNNSMEKYYYEEHRI